MVTYKCVIRADNGIRAKVLILPHHLTNFEIQSYYQNECKFKGFYWQNNLLNIVKSGT